MFLHNCFTLFVRAISWTMRNSNHQTLGYKTALPATHRETRQKNRKAPAWERATSWRRALHLGLLGRAALTESLTCPCVHERQEPAHHCTAKLGLGFFSQRPTQRGRHLVCLHLRGPTIPSEVQDALGSQNLRAETFCERGRPHERLNFDMLRS